MYVIKLSLGTIKTTIKTYNVQFLFYLTHSTIVVSGTETGTGTCTVKTLGKNSKKRLKKRKLYVNVNST